MTDYDDYDDGSEANRIERGHLRQAARDGEKARKEADSLRRELAFVRAGIPEDGPLAKLFRRHYDGAPDDPEQIAAAWAEVAPPAPVVDAADVVLPETVQDAGERASTQERSELAAGGASHERGGWTPDPRDVALATGRKVVSDGGTSDDALAAHFDVLACAAAGGDRRVRLS